MINYIVEFLGTFVFLYIILQSGGYGNLQPIVVSIGLLAAILLFGSVSGGHFNPAVTAMMYANQDPKVAMPADAIGYIVAQVLGGLVALQAHRTITTAAM